LSPAGGGSARAPRVRGTGPIERPDRRSIWSSDTETAAAVVEQAPNTLAATRGFAAVPGAAGLSLRSASSPVIWPSGMATASPPPPRPHTSRGLVGARRARREDRDDVRDAGVAEAPSGSGSGSSRRRGNGRRPWRLRSPSRRVRADVRSSGDALLSWRANRGYPRAPTTCRCRSRVSREVEARARGAVRSSLPARAVSSPMLHRLTRYRSCSPAGTIPVIAYAPR
jgi:hypothetical protein